MTQTLNGHTPAELLTIAVILLALIGVERIIVASLAREIARDARRIRRDWRL